MTKTNDEFYQESLQRFTQLGNELLQENVPKHAVATALMTASGIFSTYAAFGNSGRLNDQAIDKFSEAYKQQLQNIQQHRQILAEQRADQQVRETVDAIVSFPDEDRPDA